MDRKILYSAIAYSVFFIITLIFSLLINRILIKFSGNLGMRSNTENLIRWNTTSKPSFGGISFYIIFLLSFLTLSFGIQQSEMFHNIKLIGIVFASTLGFLMGLFDDAYNTKVLIKLSSQILCGLILIGTGTYITMFNNDILNYILTILWVVGLMNSINMLDNMDGITAVVSTSIFTGIFINNVLGVFSINENIIIVGIVASLLGFLRFNWPPSKMYMGDTGSQLLGVLLSIFSIMFIWNHKEPNFDEVPTKQICAVMLFFALPIIDTTTVSIKRIMQGKSPFVGGKDHTTHHLSYIGLSEKQVTLVFTILSVISAGLGLLCLNIAVWSHLYTVLFSIYFLLLFSVLFVIANLNKQR